MGVKESFTEAEASLSPGDALATAINVKLHEFGIIIQAMNGYGYDGPADTASKLSGVRTSIQAEIQEAHYVHCYAHCLNSAVVKSCQFLLFAMQFT